MPNDPTPAEQGGSSSERTEVCQEIKRESRGHGIPPYRTAQLRWLAFTSQETQSSEAIDQFMKGYPKEKPDKDFSVPSAATPASQSSKELPEAAEAASRTYRAAVKLIGRHKCRRSGAKVLANLSNSPGWQATIPTLNEVKEAVRKMLPLVKPATLEMERQVDDPDLFVLLVAKDKMVNPKMEHTFLLIDILLLAFGYLVYEAKALSGVQRPWQLGNKQEPSLDKPDHSSWPSGHAFVAGMMATLIHALCPGVEKEDLRKAAWRVAVNRERGGLHTRLDTLAGLEMGGLLTLDLINGVANSATSRDAKSLAAILKAAKAEWQ